MEQCIKKEFINILERIKINFEKYREINKLELLELSSFSNKFLLNKYIVYKKYPPIKLKHDNILIHKLNSFYYMTEIVISIRESERLSPSYSNSLSTFLLDIKDEKEILFFEDEKDAYAFYELRNL